MFRLSLPSWYLIVLLAAAAAFGPPSAGRAEATAGCQLARVASMSVAVRDNRIVVDGTLNGRGVAFLVDTGAQNTLLFTAAARALNLSAVDVAGAHVYGAGGEIKVQETVVDSLMLGKWSIHDWRVKVAGDSPDWTRQKIAGVLGEDFFHHFDVEFDLANRMINLYQASHCDDASLGFWPGNIAQIEIVRGLPGRWTIELAPEINGVTMQALLDSGASVTVLAASAAARLGIAPDSPGVEPVSAMQGLGAKKVAAWVGTFDSFRLGDERIRNARLRFGDISRDAKITVTGSRIAEAAIAYDLLLGADFLMAHHLLVSHSQGRMYFSYTGGPVFHAR